MLAMLQTEHDSLFEDNVRYALLPSGEKICMPRLVGTMSGSSHDTWHHQERRCSFRLGPSPRPPCRLA